MARLVPTVLIIASTSFSSAAFAGEPDGAWLTREKSVPTRSFDIVDQAARSGRPDGSRILVGRQVMPNGVVGFGFFGQKSAPSSLAPVTIGDLATHRRRKAAVGFSLKF